ncbi:MAG: DUF1592 domain-containing protein [Myxococcota bacterium]
MRGRINTVGLLLALSGCYAGVSVDAQDGGATDGAPMAPTAGADSSDEGGAPSGDDGGSGEPAGSCLDALEARPLRRLSPLQVRNTLRDLVGVEDLETPFADEADVITELGVRQLRSSTDAVLAARDAWSVEVYGCETDGEPNAGCAEDFIRRFGARAFRRPLTDAEAQAFVTIYEDALFGEQLSFRDSLDVVLATMLQSPPFVYALEHGTPVDDVEGTVLELDGYALASRMSYFLWNTMPDDALFAAAEAGELTTPEGLQQQVERMLASPKAKARVQSLVSQWLHIDGVGLRLPLEDLAKEPDLYPEYSPALMDAMRTEVQALVERVVFEDDASGFDALLLSREAYVNASLAELYGVQGPADDETFMWVTLPAEERAGLLTRGAFLSVHAGQRFQSPIARGVYILEDVLCKELGDPPPTANDTPIEPDVDDTEGPLTVRELVDVRTMDDPTCAGCHALINPTGFLFEHYDALGRWRTHEVYSGLEIDAEAALTLGDVAAPMSDAVALSESLVQSTDARACFAQRWTEAALDAEHFDPCTEDEVITRFVQTGDVRSLLSSIVSSPGFRYARVEGE